MSKGSSLLFAKEDLSSPKFRLDSLRLPRKGTISHRMRLPPRQRLGTELPGLPMGKKASANDPADRAGSQRCSDCKVMGTQGRRDDPRSTAGSVGHMLHVEGTGICDELKCNFKQSVNVTQNPREP